MTLANRHRRNGKPKAVNHVPLWMPERVFVARENQLTDRAASLFANGASLSCLVVGDSKSVLSQFPVAAFQCCVTSPPYWSLRNYHIAGQIGLELSVKEYIQNLVMVFEHVRRVLREDGTLWLNIGDSYTSGGRTCARRTKRTPFGRWISGRQRPRA